MTERGLRVGDSLDRVRELYPELQRFTDLYGDAAPYRYEWALVLEPSQVGGPPNLIDRLSAEIRKRKVRLADRLALRRRRLRAGQQHLGDLLRVVPRRHVPAAAQDELARGRGHVARAARRAGRAPATPA